MNGDGEELIEPDALDGTEGKGRFGGGFFAGSKRLNLWFKMIRIQVHEHDRVARRMLIVTYLEVGLGFAGAPDISGRSEMEDSGKTERCCCGRDGDKNMLCIRAATSAVLMGVFIPANGEDVDDVKDDFIFLRGESCVN